MSAEMGPITDEELDGLEMICDMADDADALQHAPAEVREAVETYAMAKTWMRRLIAEIRRYRLNARASQ